MTHDDAQIQNFLSRARMGKLRILVSLCVTGLATIDSPTTCAIKIQPGGENGMGHIHLATLPSTRRWREVAELLDERASAYTVAAAAAYAAEKDLAAMGQDPVLSAAVRLLALIPQAARDEDFGARLREIGIPAPDSPLLGDLTVATAMAFDRDGSPGQRTDLGEIVRRALVGTLTTMVGDGLPGLFEAGAGDVRRAAAELGRRDGFARGARAFFGRLLEDTLGSKLDRTLSTAIGGDARFRSFGEREAFDRALGQYCSEATRIIREFSAVWYGKTLAREGTITQQRAAGFTAVAMKKINAELDRKRIDRA